MNKFDKEFCRLIILWNTRNNTELLIRNSTTLHIFRLDSIIDKRLTKKRPREEIILSIEGYLQLGEVFFLPFYLLLLLNFFPSVITGKHSLIFYQQHDFIEIPLALLIPASTFTNGTYLELGLSSDNIQNLTTTYTLSPNNIDSMGTFELIFIFDNAG